MKKIVLGAVLLLVTRMALGAPIIGQAMNPPRGGCQMVVAGDGFVLGQTKFRLWSPEWQTTFEEKDETKRLMSYLDAPAPPLPEAPGKAFTDCAVLRCTPGLAAVEYPQYGAWSGPASRYFSVMYAGSDQQGWSNPYVLGQTAAYFLDRDTAAPGSFVRLQGRNLQAMYAPLPLIALIPTGGGKPILCPAQDIYYMHQHFISNYSVQFVVPATVPEGEYWVRAHNHHGEAYGWSNALTLTVAKAGPAPKILRAVDDGAKGDGVTDDTPALQKALDTAGEEAPAVVQLDAGVYQITSMLTIPAGVTLRGSGMDNTRIASSETPLFRGEPQPIEGLGEYAFQPTWSVFGVMIWGKTDFALEDLTVQGTGESAGILVAAVNGREGLTENVALRRCRFVNQSKALSPAEGLVTKRADGLLATKFWKGLFVGRARRFSIDHCVSDNTGLWAFDLRDSYVGFNKNYAPHYLTGGAAFGWGRYSENMLVEHNEVVGPRGLVGAGGARHLILAGNTVSKTLVCDGEGYMLEGAYQKWYGGAQFPDDATVMTPGTNWRYAGLTFTGLDKSDRDKWMAGLDNDLSGCLVGVTKGKGLGQYRDIAGAKGTQIKLAEPFAVVPDDTSEIAIMRGDVEDTFVCNTAYDLNGTAGGLFLAGGMNCIMEDIQGVNTGAPYIWSTFRRAPQAKGPATWRNYYVTPDYYNQILECRLIGSAGILLTSRKYGHDSADDMEAVSQLGTLVAHNEINKVRDLRAGLGGSEAEAYRCAVTVDGPVLWADVEQNTMEDTDAAVRLAANPPGAMVRRNFFLGITRVPVLGDGPESLVAPCTDKTDFSTVFGKGYNVLQQFGGTLPEGTEVTP